MCHMNIYDAMSLDGLTGRRPLLNMTVLLQNSNFLRYCTIEQGKSAQTSMIPKNVRDSSAKNHKN